MQTAITTTRFGKEETHMKNVTVTFTGEQARILLTMIVNDTEQMKQNHDYPRNLVAQNDRMEERLRKAIMKAEGRI